MPLQARAIVLAMIVSMVSCTQGLSPEEQKQLEALRSELETVRKEVSGADTQAAQYSGGLVKGLLQARLEILRTTEALIQQRIHAVESRTPVSIQTLATKPDPERAEQLAEQIQQQEIELHKAEQEAAKYSGGLVQALAISTVATHAQTLAMLRQQFLVAKLGLSIPDLSNLAAPPKQAQVASAPPSAADQPSPESKVRNEIVEVRLLRKRFTTQDYQEFLFFDVEYRAAGLDKPARAIKGALNLTDLFGETKMKIGWSIDKPIKPGETIEEKSMGFKFNQFLQPHQWVRATELANMKASFTVSSILYEDGSRRDLE